MTLDELRAAVAADLARSGISVPFATAPPPAGLGYDAVLDAACVHPSLAGVSGMVIPYYMPDGSPLLNADGTHFARIRVHRGYEPPPPAGLKPLKRPKYLQGAGTSVEPYFAPIGPWAAILADADYPLVITEGEKKAVATCLAEIPCIGLGGVHSFLRDGAFHPLLAEIEWRNRIVYIAFDSDAADKPMIRDAERRLATELSTRRHADVRLVRLKGKPGGIDANGKKQPDEKVGLDDLYVSGGAQAIRDALETATQLSRLDREVLRMNESVAWVRSEGRIYFPASGRYIAKHDFVNGDDFSSWKIERIGQSKKGPIALPPIHVASEWLKHPNRRGYEDVIFRPGEPELIEQPDGVALNSWQGLAVREGDATPFVEVTDRVFSQVEPQWRDFALKLLAYKAQNPGVHVPIAIVLVGGQGTGKGTWSSMVARAFAPYSEVMSAVALKDTFNGYVERNLIIVVNETEGHVMKDVAPKLKNYIADPLLSMRAMYRPARQVQSYATYILTANDHAAGSFAADDRRYFVVHTPHPDASLSYWFKQRSLWAEQNGPVIQHYLQNYDLQGWTPPGHAPTTIEKSVAFGEGLTPIGRVAEMMKRANGPNVIFMWITSAIQWADEMLTAPPDKLSPAMFKKLHAIKNFLPLQEVRPFYSAEELNMIFPALAEELAGYRGGDIRSLTPAKLSKALRDAGIGVLLPADDPNGFWRNNTQSQYLIVSDVKNPMWQKHFTQAEFEAMIHQSPKYYEMAKSR